MVLYLPDEALAALDITPSEMVEAVEKALRDKAAGNIHVTPKSAVLPGDGRYMMATLSVGDITVVKQVTVSPNNPARGLAAINGAVIALDAETGLLRAVMGANWITAHRTAALSAVAARQLADPHSSVITFVGCGVQAHSHLRAFHDLFPLKKVIAVGRGLQNVERLGAYARELGLAFQHATSPKEALEQADIVVSSITLDYSIEPFLDPASLKSNAFAAITDLCIPWKPLTDMGTIIVDDLEQETTAEKPMLPANRITGDITDLVTGRLEIDPTRPRAFAFRGIALGDYAAAALALRKAEETGAGQRIG